VKIVIFTIFPELIEAACRPSILGLAIEKGLLEVEVVDIREHTTDRHRKVDDIPFGGGAGMVMMAQPIADAIDARLAADAAAGEAEGPGGAGKPRVVFLTPSGRPFHQDVARELAGESTLYLVCGRYKGIDDRVRRRYADDEISIGDYVLSGGELPALVVVDAVMRLLPGALGDFASAEEDSIHSGLLEVPLYTRPREFRGDEVPEVLLSGHHENIRRWRRRRALETTLDRRPELLEKADLTEEDRRFLDEIRAERSGSSSRSRGAS
jgi:tRNA (guanine37-N1)-methyltransferase